MEIAIPPAVAPDDPRSVARAMASPSRFGDKAFEWLTLAMAMAVMVLVILTGWQLWRGSSQAIQKFGFHFLATSTWDPVAEQFGALPFIYGTLVSSLIALLIAVPLSIATAVYLTELAPLSIRQPLVSLIEMLAAIPSVILGLWGIFVMVPWLRDYPFPWLKRLFGWTPFFSGPIYGTSTLGETMAVTMVIGNTPQIAASLFKPGYTLASVIANEFTEATTDIYLEALFEIGLVLFGVTILVNLIAQLLLKTMTTTTSGTRAVQ